MNVNFNTLQSIVFPFVAIEARPNRMVCNAIARSLEGQECWQKVGEIVADIGLVLEWQPAPTGRMLVQSLGVNVTELDAAVKAEVSKREPRLHHSVAEMVHAAQNEAISLLLRGVKPSVREAHMVALVEACKRNAPPAPALVRGASHRI